MYDVTKKESFDNISRWLKELKTNAEPDIAIMIVGNKVDLCEEDSSQRRVTKEEAEKFAASQNAMFEETSAITSANVKSAFENLMQSTKLNVTI